MALRCPEEKPTAERLRPYPLRIAPAEGESLPGFVLRLAQRNRLPNGKWLRDDIGLRYGQNEWSDENFRRLATLSGQPEEALRRLHHPLRADGTVQFKTGFVDKFMLERWVMRYCPVCLDEQGHHQSIWFLRFVTVCPWHGARLIEQCPSCSRRLPWRRPKLLECACAAPLPVGPIPAQEIVPADELLGVRLLYEKCGVVHGAPSLLDRLPDMIRGLGLEDFITLLWFIGNTRNDFKAHKSRTGFLRTPDADAHLALRHAFDLATDWPRRFHQWLARTRQTPAATGHAYGLRQQFPLLKPKLRAIHSSAALQIVQEAFLAFAKDNGIYIQPTETLFVPKGSSSAARMVSVTEAARILEVSVTLAARLAREQGWIDPRAPARRLPRPIAEDVVREFAKHFHAGIDLGAATKRLKVEHATLIELLEAGIIGRRRGRAERRRRGSFAWSITDADIVEFQRRIDAAIRPLDDSSRRRLTTLLAIHQRRSSHGVGYADLLRAVLDGRLVPRGQQASRGPGGLLFDVTEALRFCATAGSGSQLLVTTGPAAKTLGIDRGYILAGVHLGLIRVEGRDGRGGYQFTLDEVQRFGREFTTAQQLAQEYDRPQSWMTVALKAAGIVPKRVKSGALQKWCLYSVQDLKRRRFAKFVRRYKTYRERRREGIA